MSELVFDATTEALEALAPLNIPVLRTQIEEIVSSLLGYPSFAEFVREDEEGEDELGLDHADVLVLDHPSAEKRAAEVLAGSAEPVVSEVVEACVQSIAECAGVAMFDDVDELFRTWASRELELVIENCEGVDRALLKRVGPVEMSDRWEAKASPWESLTEWTIEAKAVRRESAGQPVLDCVGYLTFRKAGRAGLVMDDCGAACVLRDAT